MYTLRQCTVNEDVFNDILVTMSKRITVTDNLKQYYGGYKNKKHIFYDGKEYLIIQEYLLNHFLNEDKIEDCSDWKQVIVRKVENQTQECQADITGLMAYQYMLKALEKVYDFEDIKQILSTYTTPYDYKKAQFHYNYTGTQGKIVKHENCYKYDINSAYAFVLMEVFPKAKEIIQKLYDGRKERPQNKKYLNYFIGFLKHKGYDGFYNYTVQKVSQMVKQAILKTDGQLIYANTDGFIVKNPSEQLMTSKTIGEFKLESSGTMYSYQDKNYIVYQFTKDGEKELVGNLRNCVRHLVDLSENKVVHYDLVRVKTNNIQTIEVKNIEQEIINHEESY